MRGEMNIAIKIATWLASVNEAGSSTIFIGENIGIMSPIAISKPDTINLIVLWCSIKNALLC